LPVENEKTREVLQRIRGAGFLVAIAIAVIGGLLSSEDGPGSLLVSVLVLLGMLGGLTNVRSAESRDFLLASVALVFVSTFGGPVLKQVSVIGPYLDSVLLSILALMTPAAVVVAIIALFRLAMH
jgi:hypothetical protein